MGFFRKLLNPSMPLRAALLCVARLVGDSEAIKFAALWSSLFVAAPPGVFIEAFESPFRLLGAAGLVCLKAVFLFTKGLLGGIAGFTFAAEVSLFLFEGALVSVLGFGDASFWCLFRFGFD